MKTFRFIAAAALAASFPALAHAAGAGSASSFTRNGITYNYTVETRGSVKVIRGNDGAKDFALWVRDNHVSGIYGSSSVEFDLAKDKQAEAQLFGAR